MANRNPAGRKKGTPKTGGRQRGTPNKVTRSARVFCESLLVRPAYQRKFLKAWDARELPPRLEQMVWEYANGKPPQSYDVNVSGALTLAKILSGEFTEEDDQHAR